MGGKFAHSSEFEAFFAGSFYLTRTVGIAVKRRARETFYRNKFLANKFCTSFMALVLVVGEIYD